MKKISWAPYLLVLPSLLYLLLFFAYPMYQAFQLAFTKNIDYLNLRAEAKTDSAFTGQVAMQTVVDVVDRTSQQETLANGQKRPVFWFKVNAQDSSGKAVQGWVSQRNVFIESRTESTAARVTSGDPTKQWTLDFLKRTVEDFRFGPALLTTIVLILAILPLQFALAIIMALVLQSEIRGSSLFLYIYAIPLGISELTAGIVWYSIFTQQGFMNSFLMNLGLLNQPFIFIQAGHQGWMIGIIVLAEVWRATSIVMVIVVAGLQAIPRDYLEASELFGASMWQRLWQIILPLLKPSLQVALILRTILAFQVFAVLVAITGGDAVTVLGNETFRWYDPARFNNPNVASVYAGFILVLSLGISLFYLRAVRTQEEAAKSI